MAFFNWVLYILLLLKAVEVSEECLKGGLDSEVQRPPVHQKLHFLEPGPEDEHFIAPQLAVTCHGRITSWSGLTVMQKPHETKKYMHKITFSVWRPRKGGQYNLIGQNPLSFEGSIMEKGIFSMDNTSGSLPSNIAYFQFNDKRPLASIIVQPGDVLGWSVHKATTGTLPLSVVSKKKESAEGSFLEVAQLNGDPSNAYCSSPYCDVHSEPAYILPYITFTYELDNHKAGFYIPSSGGECKLPNITCASKIAKYQSNVKSTNSPTGISTNTMIIAIITGVLTVGFLLFTLFCAVNYTFFHYHSKGTVYPSVERQRDSRSASQSHVFLESSFSRSCRNSSSYPRMVPPINTESILKVNPNQDQSNTMCMARPATAVSPSSFLSGYYLSQKSILKQSSVSLEANVGSLESTLVSDGDTQRPSIATMDKLSVSEVVHTSENFDVPAYQEYIVRSDTEVSEAKDISGIAAQWIESCTEFSGSLADTITCSKETNVNNGNLIQDESRQEIGQRESAGDAENNAEKKQSVLFKMMDLPSEITVNPVKPYFSSGTTPGKAMELDSDVDACSVRSMARKSI